MSEREAFLKNIIANPDDDAVRLVFADWLDEHGEPERAQGIRIQCEWERYSRHTRWDVSLRPDMTLVPPSKERLWLRDNRDALERSCRAIARADFSDRALPASGSPFEYVVYPPASEVIFARVTYRRGFVEEVHAGTYRAWSLLSSLVIGRHPVRTVTLQVQPEIETEYDPKKRLYWVRVRGGAFALAIREEQLVMMIPDRSILVRDLLAGEHRGIKFRFAGA